MILRKTGEKGETSETSARAEGTQNQAEGATMTEVSEEENGKTIDHWVFLGPYTQRDFAWTSTNPQLSERYHDQVRNANLSSCT